MIVYDFVQLKFKLKKQKFYHLENLNLVQRLRLKNPLHNLLTPDYVLERQKIKHCFEYVVFHNLKIYVQNSPAKVPKSNIVEIVSLEFTLWDRSTPNVEFKINLLFKREFDRLSINKGWKNQAKILKNFFITAFTKTRNKFLCNTRIIASVICFRSNWTQCWGIIVSLIYNTIISIFKLRIFCEWFVCLK